MHPAVFVLLLLAVTLFGSPSLADHETSTSMQWIELAPIPDRIGFAGSFAGVSNGALLVAGGANFPDVPPGAGGTKTWYDSVFVLENPEAGWKTGLKLPQPRAYGVSFSTGDGMIIAGGSDDKQHFTDVTLLNYRGKELIARPLLSLPRPCAMMSGVQLGSKLYIAGGTETPTATAAMNTFWELDLNASQPVWKDLPDCPGPGRMLSTLGTLGESIYLFSGAALVPGPEGKPVREWLRDAYRYDPGIGWTTLPNLPRISVAAPTPAIVLSPDRLMLAGGDDGTQINVSPGEHSGFPKKPLIFHAADGTWAIGPEAPFSLVTTSTAQWHGGSVIPGGEARPGIRSTHVWWLRNIPSGGQAK